MARFTDSLSVVLPVYNDVANVAGRVTELLEVLPELTNSFEILVVDNGSTDRTEEAAFDLERQFPQVRVVSLPHRVSGEELEALGLERTGADFVTVAAENSRVSAARLKGLWVGRKPEATLAAGNRSVVESLRTWAANLPLPDLEDDQIRIIRRQRRAATSPTTAQSARWSAPQPTWAAAETSPPTSSGV